MEKHILAVGENSSGEVDLVSQNTFLQVRSDLEDYSTEYDLLDWEGTTDVAKFLKI